MSVESRLISLQKQRAEAQTQCAERDGQIKRIMSELKKRFGCTSIKEAREKYKAFQKKAEVRTKKLMAGIDEMEEAMSE